MMDELSRWYESLTYEEAKNILREKLDNMKMSFIAAGYYMKYIRDHELFREDGYESIWEFAEDNYGIKKSTASRWMSMNDKFSQGGNSPILADEYREFEKSQLQEMLYLDDKQMETVTPDMTVKEIREIRKPEQLSAYGTKKRAYPEDSLLKTEGCEGGHDCCSCAQECAVRGEYRYCQDAPMGNPFPCDTMDSLSYLREAFGNKCLFVNQDLAEHYVTGDANPCCKDCKNPCTRECGRAFQFRTEKNKKKEKKVAPIDRGCITGKNPNGNCTCCGKDGVECCGQCDDDCNSRCGWIDSAVATSQRDEPVVDMNPPEEEPDPEPEVITRENIEVVGADEDKPAEELYEETSDRSDIDLLQGELDKAENNLDLMRSCYSEKDIRVRKQKLIIEALKGIISTLDAVDIPEPQQPELPFFRNNDQRKEWLRNYQNWGIWYEDKNIGARYYKYDFANGARLIAEEYTRPATEWYGEHISSFLHLVGGPEPPRKGCVSKWQRHEVYDRFPSNETELVEFLKYVQKEGK